LGKGKYGKMGGGGRKDIFTNELEGDKKRIPC